MKLMPLDGIKADDAVNPRARGLDAAAVAEYAAELEAGAEFPPVTVYHDGEANWLSEGFHRLAAYRRAGRSEIPAEVRRGGRTDALLNALASNQTHGLKRTNEDKRLAVRLALETVPDWTDEKIAGHCGVSDEFVSTVRTAIIAENTVGEGEESETPTVGVSGQGSRGPAKKKPDHAKAAARLLLKDHARTDDDVAKEVGCKEKTVRIARKALADKGRIPVPAKKQAEPPSLGVAAGEGAGEERPPSPEPDPAAGFVATVEALCRDLDQIAARVRGLKESPYSYAIHWQSAADQVAAARTTLWNGRPTHACPYCEAEGEVKPGCRACRGTGRVHKGTHERGTAAVGGAR